MAAFSTSGVIAAATAAAIIVVTAAAAVNDLATTTGLITTGAKENAFSFGRMVARAATVGVRRTFVFMIVGNGSAGKPLRIGCNIMRQGKCAANLNSYHATGTIAAIPRNCSNVGSGCVIGSTEHSKAYHLY